MKRHILRKNSATKGKGRSYHLSNYEGLKEMIQKKQFSNLFENPKDIINQQIISSPEYNNTGRLWKGF